MAGFATIAALDEHSFIYGCLHATPAAAPAAPAAASGGAVPAKLVEECKKAGEAVAAAKKSGASKDEIAAKVDKLLSLKKQITALDPNHALAIVDKKKKAKATKMRKNTTNISRDCRRCFGCFRVVPSRFMISSPVKVSENKERRFVFFFFFFLSFSLRQ